MYEVSPKSTNAIKGIAGIPTIDAAADTSINIHKLSRINVTTNASL
jgi:hypothetical protein